MHGDHLITANRTVDVVVSRLQQYPGAAKLILDSNQKRSIEPKEIKMMLAVLLSARTVQLKSVLAAEPTGTPSHPSSTKPVVVFTFTLHAPGVFTMHVDSYWENINTK